jgi:hypothetical protein
MKRDVVEFGDIIENDNRRMDALNNKLDNMNNRAQNNVRRMENYLERTSSCQIYVVLGIELFIFLILMSI